MDLKVFLLIILSAFFHAFWNFAARKAKGHLVVLWLGIWVAAISCFPFAIFFISTPDILGVVYILATGFLHALYFILLGKCYQNGEISVVYPIARGTGIAGTFLLAKFFIGETTNSLGIMGIVAILIGIFCMGTANLSKSHYKSIGFALLVGITISSYSIVDKLGANSLHPVFYIFSMYLLTALFLTPYAWPKQNIKSTWHNYRKEILIIGIGSMGTYLLILFAFQLGNVSYIVAIREFSVVIGALMGIVLLKESFTLKKGIAIVTIALGMILIKISY